LAALINNSNEFDGIALLDLNVQLFFYLQSGYRRRKSLRKRYEPEPPTRVRRFLEQRKASHPDSRPAA
jgi:hypothetical protein